MKRFASVQFLGRSFLFLLGALVLALMVQTVAWAQTGTGTVAGVVTDPQKAIIQGATVTITNKDTGYRDSVSTQADGHYVLPNVPPGMYDLTVSGKGFDTAKVSGLTVKLGLTTTVDVQMKIGTPTETVEVKSTTTDLQTLDASVGNVMDQNMLEKLPSLSRDATAILLLQPMASPGFNGAPGSGESNLTGGSIAGARADQNTFMLDGGDATSNTEGGGGYAQQAGSGFSATPRAAIPTPVESLQEMRVVTNNSNTFARSAGGEVQMVTRSGSNQWHGAVYENNQNTDYNANTWTNNNNRKPGASCLTSSDPSCFGLPRSIWLDNRYGARFGGPIKKDKAFFFLMYEGHNFKKGVPFTRLVPSTLLRQGIMQYPDTGGTIHQVDLKTSAVCGGACDPRALGLSPAIASIWAFEPPGNDPSVGDGMNTIGFTSNVPVTVNDNYAVGRLDYKWSENWQSNATYHYAVSDGIGAGQIDIGGLLSGDTKGAPTAIRKLPTQPRYLTFGTTGHLTSNLTTEAHFNWLRHWWQWSPVSPFPQTPLVGMNVQIYAESVTNGMVPINVDTQNARRRNWNGKDFTWSDNSSWLHGKHLFVWGGEFRHEHFTHTRDDKVVGSMTSPQIYAVNNSNFSSSGIPLPTDMASSFSSNWKNAYVAMTGMVNRAGQLLTRNSSFGPNPAGTPLFQNTIVDYYNLYFADTWRMTSNFNVTLGLGWGAQTPPFETTGEQTIMVDTATNKPVVLADYLAASAAAANNGTVFAPLLGFVPVKSLGLKYPYNAEWNDFEPRLSFAWNPSSFLSGIFGDHRSVIRGGYGRYHDRLNGVGLVMTPALGIGFGNTVQCRRPRESGGVFSACNVGKTSAANAFRVGVDGSTLPLPSLAAITGGACGGSNCVIPGSDAGVTGANSPFEILDFRIDPTRKTGVEDTWTLSIERSLPGRSLLEIGYVGRVGHHLYGAGDINQAPYMLKLGGQTYAQAFDAVAKALRAGQPVPAQPFFETLSGPGGTAAAVASDGSNFVRGHAWIAFDDLIGLPVADGQLDVEQQTTSWGNSNYHAGYVSFRKDFSHGLLFQANYTFAHSLDTVGFTQENVFISQSDNFNKGRDYGPSLFDRRHTLTLFFVYDLPFGKGHALASHGIADKIFGGWSWSGAFQAASAIPIIVNNAELGGECDMFANGDGSGACQNSQLALAGAPTNASTNYSRNPAVCGNPAGSPQGCVLPFGLTPTAAAALFREPFFSDTRLGFGEFRSYPRWNFDAALSKTTSISERVKLGFGVQAVNVFNHMDFNDPGLDVSNPGKFGVTTGQYSSPRFLNLNIRVDF